MRKRKEIYTRYCPGSAVGSPATMADSEARTRIEIDSAYLGRMMKTGTVARDATLPHTGPCPPTCPHYDP